jgi:hypothetical protein
MKRGIWIILVVFLLISSVIVVGWPWDDKPPGVTCSDEYFIDECLWHGITSEGACGEEGDCEFFCGDEMDNDENGKIDCADPVCEGILNQNDELCCQENSCPDDFPCEDNGEFEGVVSCEDDICTCTHTGGGGEADLEDCFNGEDDDGDLDVDCDDDDCDVMCTCEDSDDTDEDTVLKESYYVKGKVTGMWKGWGDNNYYYKTKEDSCAEKKGFPIISHTEVESCMAGNCRLKEHHCDLNIAKYFHYHCPAGCTDGACNEITADEVGLCSDLADNDNDGSSDCQDWDCLGDEYCVGEVPLKQEGDPDDETLWYGGGADGDLELSAEEACQEQIGESCTWIYVKGEMMGWYPLLYLPCDTKFKDYESVLVSDIFLEEYMLNAFYVLCEGTPEDCYNGIDDNDDHLIDCQDPKCKDVAVGPNGQKCEPGEELTCDDGFNNDGNYLWKSPCPNLEIQETCETLYCLNDPEDVANCAELNQCTDSTDCLEGRECKGVLYYEETVNMCIKSSETCFNNIDDDNNNLEDCDDPGCKSFCTGYTCPKCKGAKPNEVGYIGGYKNECCESVPGCNWDGPFNNMGKCISDETDEENGPALSCADTQYTDLIPEEHLNPILETARKAACNTPCIFVDGGDNSAKGDLCVGSSEGMHCNDDYDNDADGDKDCDDEDCLYDSSCVTEICDDDIDNDEDGLLDCFDKECSLCPKEGWENMVLLKQEGTEESDFAYSNGNSACEALGNNMLCSTIKQYWDNKWLTSGIGCGAGTYFILNNLDDKNVPLRVICIEGEQGGGGLAVKIPDTEPGTNKISLFTKIFNWFKNIFSRTTPVTGKGPGFGEGKNPGFQENDPFDKGDIKDKIDQLDNKNINKIDFEDIINIMDAEGNKKGHVADTDCLDSDCTGKDGPKGGKCCLYGSDCNKGAACNLDHECLETDCNDGIDNDDDCVLGPKIICSNGVDKEFECKVDEENNKFDCPPEIVDFECELDLETEVMVCTEGGEILNCQLDMESEKTECTAGDEGVDCLDSDCQLYLKGVTETSCSDGKDNDGDCLTDCQDEDCNNIVCGGTAGAPFVCSNQECKPIASPGQAPTVLVEKKLFSYNNLLEELNKCTVEKSQTPNTCDNLCLDKTCVFANAGTKTCQEEGSNICTCC